jgi:PAS domain S-box-containing protein
MKPDRADILIVDDNPANLRLLAETLTGDGYSVRAAPNGRLAVDAAKARTPDLILLDVRMPDMDGFEVCSILKRDDGCRDVPVIFLSALHETADKLKGFEVGGVDYITKPFAPDEVLARVRTQVSLRAMQRQLIDAAENLEKLVEQRTGELARTVADLTESEARFRMLMAASPIPMLVVGAPPEQPILLVNERFVEVFGYARDELPDLETWWPRAYPNPDYRRRVQESWAPAVASVQAGQTRQAGPTTVDIACKDGAVRTVELQMVMSADRGLVIFNDITAAKEAEHKLHRTIDALTRSNADLERFAYAASHDLKEPLRGIVLTSQLLERKFGDALGDEGAELIGFLVDDARRMVDLVQGLLEFSRVESQGQKFQLLNTDKAVAVALETLSQSLAESGARVVCGPLPQVMADEVQIIHVFQNLIGNAIKFRRTDAPPHITINAVPGGDEWEFSVADNGIGIDPAYAHQIFVIFKRLHTHDAYPGSGIGLALCKRIVERHGGRIWFDSDLGRGTTFHFTLPSVGGGPAQP